MAPLPKFENIIFDTTSEGFARDYALAFISDVNWWEIANHLIANLEDETEGEPVSR